MGNVKDYCLEMLRQVNNTTINNCVGLTHTISESDFASIYSMQVFDYYDTDIDTGNLADLEQYEQWLITKK